MKKAKTIITITGVFIFLFTYGNMSGNMAHFSGSNSDQQDPKSVQTKTKSSQTVTKSTQAKTKPAQTVTKSTQTKTKSAQTVTKSKQAKSKSTQKTTKPEVVTKVKDAEAVVVGTKSWAIANLNVSTFRNGDSIPQAKTNKDWIAAGEAGKPAWCYYNNDPAIGLKYGKLYNWFAVNDPRGLAPVGWTLPNDSDWAKMSSLLGGQESAGIKLKNTSRWNDGSNGTNETGFTAFPAGYRAENGAFMNIGNIASWWSSTEDNTVSAIDHYLSLRNSLGRSSSPKKRGESVRCIRE